MIKPFDIFKAQCRGVVRLWLQCMVVTLIATAFFGPFAPLTIPAFLLTLGSPILLLTLWGRSLDKEFGWTDQEHGPR